LKITGPGLVNRTIPAITSIGTEKTTSPTTAPSTSIIRFVTPPNPYVGLSR